MISPWVRPSFVSHEAAFRSGSYSPLQYLERCIEGIDARESEVLAFVRMDRAAARRAAEASTLRWREGRPKSVLDGMPIGVKDIIETRDFPTEMGSAVFAGWQSRRDAACVHVLREVGAIVVGKTVTTEFAVGAGGPTRNPLDLTRTPAGSSSGSAAAVAAGMLPFALGTQTQSSTLRPASFCGIYGFKPSFGALPLGGVHPLAESHDHLGLLAGSLDDLWACASAISDRFGAATLPPARRPRQLAWLKTAGWSALEEEVRNRLRGLLSVLAAAGVPVCGEQEDREIAQFESLLLDADEASEDILAYEMRWPFAEYLAHKGEMVSERVHGLVSRGQSISAVRYRDRIEYRESLRRQLLKLRGRFDAIVSLAASGVAPVGLQNTGARSFPIPGSLLGAPSFSLPLLAHGGLPLGVQVIGFPGHDAETAAFARWISDFRDRSAVSGNEGIAQSHHV